jgi:FkbM family methyltransferase
VGVEMKLVNRIITIAPWFINSAVAWRISRFFLAIQGIAWGGDIKDSGELPLLKKQLKGKDRPIVFDVGAHVGEYLDACLATNSNVRLHCFEPSAEHFKKLSSKIPIRNTNVQVNHFGLGSQEGTFTLFRDEDISGLAGFKKRDLDHLDIHFSLEEACEVRTPLAYCKENEIEYIDWMKIDVEGAEFDVLDGFRPFFRDEKIGACQFEYGHANIESKLYFRDFFKFFASYGYSLGILKPNGKVTPILKYEEKYENMYIANFVATSNSTR